MSSPVVTKEFAVSSHDLGESATLTFVFDVSGSDQHKPYKNFFPVIWKVIPFSKTGNNAYPFEYSNEFSFVRPSNLHQYYPSPSPPSNGGGDTWFPPARKHERSTPDIWKPVTAGQQIVLDHDSDGALQMTLGTQAASLSNAMELLNNSGLKEDIVLGIPERGKSIPRYIRVFPEIGDGSSVQATFTPIVQAYVTKEYSEADVLKSPISGKPIWTQNLDSLKAETEWRLIHEPQSGTFKLQQIA